MMYDLPKSVALSGVQYEIRSDFRPILDIMTAMTDPELSWREKTFVLLSIFYQDAASIPPEDGQAAVEECFRFISGGKNDPEDKKKQPRLVSWNQDFPYIVAPINRVLGQEIRSIPYLHWWTFLSAYMEIGDCTFAQIVRIRDKKVRGKKLDKTDQEWYRKNRDLVDIKTTYTQAEEAILKEWGGR